MAMRSAKRRSARCGESAAKSSMPLQSSCDIKSACSNIIMANTDPFYPDTDHEEAQNVCRPGYVRVMCCERSACLQIREDIVQQSQVMAFLASARDPSNPSECIHMANPLANVDNMTIVCEWLSKHLEFAQRGAEDAERLTFDRQFFLLNARGKADYAAAANDQAKAEILDSRKDWIRWRQDDPENEDGKRAAHHGAKTPAWQRPGPVEERRHRTYQEIQQIMFVANFLELHPTEWHTSYAAKEVERLNKLPPGPFQEFDLDPADKFAETVMELCCHHLGDMILGCESPVDMQHRFPDLIGAKALSAKDRADIVKADLWIHGDDFVKEVIDELRKEDPTIPEWTLESTLEERAFMKDIPGFQDQEQPIKVPPIKINPDQPADAGFEIGHHWWG